MSSKVSIATKPLVYSAFRYLSNKIYNALAEYVDNSVQSFLYHKDVLSKINDKGKVTVEITIESGKITIRDNAWGIDEQHYQKAFELANIPLDAKGLNEFGMGMKVSSIWLSNEWSVETSAYGENTKKTVLFNLNDVVSHSRVDLDVKTEYCKSNSHYTIVRLKDLSQNVPAKGMSIKTIEKHLTSIYTNFIREGVLELIINGKRQEIEQPEILVAPYWKRPTGPDIKWFKEINFKAPKGDGTNYEVKGFIGVLKEMSTNDKNGFMLFRRGRVIGTSGENKYRPYALCGGVGSPKYKRIFGELYLEGFNVSFTKNSFNEDEDFETFIELLAEDISNNKEFDIFGQAEEYRKPKPKLPVTTISSTVTKAIAQGFRETPAINTKPVVKNNINTKPEIQDQSTVITEKPIIPVVIDENPDFDKEAKPIDEKSSNITIDGIQYTLIIRAAHGANQTGLYRLLIIDNDNYEITFNMDNPFFERFNDLFEKPENMEHIVAFVKTMVSAEISLQRTDGDYAGTIFRNKFNAIFGNI